MPSPIHLPLNAHTYTYIHAREISAYQAPRPAVVLVSSAGAERNAKVIDVKDLIDSLTSGSGVF